MGGAFPLLRSFLHFWFGSVLSKDNISLKKELLRHFPWFKVKFGRGKRNKRKAVLVTRPGDENRNFSSRPGYVTLPRRPHAPSSTSSPPVGLPPTVQIREPIYDGVGPRTSGMLTYSMTLFARVTQFSPDSNGFILSPLKIKLSRRP